MAQNGMTRTFQSIRLFTEMTALDNVMVGFHLQLKAGFWAHLLQTRRAVDEETHSGARRWHCSNSSASPSVTYDRAQNLSYGQQRLLEIARALAVRPLLLMLDEPAAGVNPTELQQLVRIIRKIKDAGVTLLVIEHHMDLIMGVSDVISVLDFGQKIAEGNGGADSTRPEGHRSLSGRAVGTCGGEPHA